MGSGFFEYLKWTIQAGRARVAAAVGLLVLTSLTEGIGLVLLIPVLHAAGVSQQADGRAAGGFDPVSALLAAAGVAPSLSVLLGALLVVTAAGAWLGRVQSTVLFGVEQGFLRSTRGRVYRAIVNAEWATVGRTRTPDLIHALTEQTDRVGVGAYTMLMLAGDIVLGIIYVAIALPMSWTLTLLVLSAAALLAFALHRTARGLRAAGTEIAQAMNAFYAATIEHVQSLKTMKAYGAQERNLRIFSRASAELSHAYMTSARRQASSTAAFEVGSVVILCIGLFVAISVLALSPAVILILLLIYYRLMPRFMSSHRHYRNLVGMLPSFVALRSLVESLEAVAEPRGGQGRGIRLQEALRLEDLTYTHRAVSTPAVQGIDIEIKAGSIVALVGPSGAGKSTIADLLMGLLTPGTGRLVVDGTVLSSRDVADWRSRIGYVAQESVLFNQSVRDNLLWAQPGASEADMIAALRSAAAIDFVLALPQGLDTPIGERGQAISQGERQRLALARALLRRPDLLVLDESTNSIDSGNETRILEAIRELRGKVGVLLISHRLSTVRWADRIYVLESGRIVESGSWTELAKRPHGRFRTLFDAQRVNPFDAGSTHQSGRETSAAVPLQRHAGSQEAGA